MRYVWSAALCAALAVSACESSTDQGDGPPPLTQLPRALSVQERAVIDASNRFAFDILRETLTLDTAENVFLSPVSATMALGMTMNGARNATFDGMRKALGFEAIPQADINQSYRGLIDLLLSLDASVEMKVANSVWARQNYPFEQSFFNTVEQFFDAEVATLDFSASNAAATINDWVDKGTNGKIKEIVDNPLPPDAVMYLINAIYFKGSWRHKYDASKTANAPFHLANGTTTQVRMMSRTGNFKVGYDNAVQIIEQSYGREAFAMTIALPPEGTDVRTLAANLDAATWQRWTSNLHETDGPLRMPKFKLEYETSMNDPLITLGMGAAFGVEPGTDFTGMSSNGLNLYISNVKQKTYIDVNEEGTEAAAVTSVEIRETSAPQEVVIDRPFLVAIRERLSGTILFLGVIGRP